jgi:hypothetical protein
MHQPQQLRPRPNTTEPVQEVLAPVRKIRFDCLAVAVDQRDEASVPPGGAELRLK